MDLIGLCGFFEGEKFFSLVDEVGVGGVVYSCVDIGMMCERIMI